MCTILSETNEQNGGVNVYIVHDSNESFYFSQQIRTFQVDCIASERVLWIFQML